MDGCVCVCLLKRSKTSFLLDSLISLHFNWSVCILLGFLHFRSIHWFFGCHSSFCDFCHFRRTILKWRTFSATTPLWGISATFEPLRFRFSTNHFSRGPGTHDPSVLANEDQRTWGWKRTCFLNCWTSCYSTLFYLQFAPISVPVKKVDATWKRWLQLALHFIMRSLQQWNQLMSIFTFKFTRTVVFSTVVFSLSFFAHCAFILWRPLH